MAAIPANLQRLLDAPVPRFSDAEITRRREAARDLLAQAECDHLVFCGANRAGSAVQWLTQWPVTAEAVGVLTPGELDRVRGAVDSLAPLAGRLAFLAPPFRLERVAAAGTDFGANVLILDYIQRFTVGDGKGDKREQLETAATVLRRFCDAGAALRVASAVARQKTAVMLAGSIPTRVGRPQKRSRPAPG